MQERVHIVVDERAEFGDVAVTVPSAVCEPRDSGPDSNTYRSSLATTSHRISWRVRSLAERFATRSGLTISAQVIGATFTQESQRR